MAEESNLPDVPPPPPAPDAPVQEDSATLKIPASMSSETPQNDAERPEEQDPDIQTGNPPQDGSGDSEATEGDAEETPQEPVVENGPNGQTVTMPDGSVVTTRTHPFPVSNHEQENYELTHHGDQLRYPYKPGDAAYSPYSDPAVPDSRIARQIEQEIGNFGERVLQDVEAHVSPIWQGLKKVYDGELKQAIETGGGSGKVEA